MERIYHSYDKWEDFKHGFYDSVSGKNKELLIESVAELFSSPELTEEYMQRVLNEWVFSCEHNLTNTSLNRIAYLGQSACCLYAKVPSSVTIGAYSKLPKEIRDRSDKIARILIKRWEQKRKSKSISMFGKSGAIQMEFQMKFH